ncbi:MAG: type II secretion system protein [Gammaproteobacteria bacterium]|nr:MAG: type II secretion system protein [Gammaproteobacteria bacterium]
MKIKKDIFTKNTEYGFSLVEMAIVLVIIGLLAGGILIPISEQLQSTRLIDNKNQMETIKEAILGFAIANGRLPCPATVNSNGMEAPQGGGTCTTAHGFVPHQSLGLSGQLNEDIIFSDPWNNPYGYSVTVRDINQNGQPDFTTTGELKNVITDPALVDETNEHLGLRALSLTYAESASWFPSPCSGSGNTNCNDLEVYNDTGAGRATLTFNAPVVIYSLGKNWAEYNVGGTGVPSTYEAENVGATITGSRNYNVAGNTEFISREKSEQQGRTFDDEVIWISKPILIGKLLSAGQISAP